MTGGGAQLERALCEGAGWELPFRPSTGTSDMRHFVTYGVPCVLFGPGRGANPHRADEWYEVSSLDETMGVLTRTVERWCA